jgi:hypothetical protein
VTSNWYHITTGQFGYPQPENNFGYVDKTYDTSNACLTCNIGLRQKGEFRFKSEPKAKDSQFIGLNWVFDQIFVRQEVKDIFEMEKVNGIEFSNPVINKTGLPINGLYQLHVDNLLSEGLITEDLKFEICELPKDKSELKFLEAIKSKLIQGPFCGHKKYNFPHADNYIKIKAESIDNQTDFLRLNYYFGSGGSANRPIIVSDRVKKIIDRNKWRGVFLKEIILS